ncbi:WXG100 family type VII secretion target [Kitasatospora sp. KL5]|uniref:WXG100 family type VII secretion target n=1 Tax=Kitasatospora sp. KL5 TaxID=3425125 RepID=UPI003D6E8615
MTEKRFIRRIHRDGDDFGGTSHEQLVAMVDSADPVAVMQVGQRLLLAAQKMDEISNELHAHMSGLDWQGEAADNFKTWGGNVSRSTMQLAEYSRNAGTYMATAGETLSEVKRTMPDVPTSDMEIVRRYEAQPNTAVSVGGFIAGGAVMPGIGNVVGGWAADKVANMVDSDWVTEAEAQAARKRIDQAHQDAIQQMSKLGQSYDQSVTRLNSAQPPEFPPVPGAEGRHGGQNVDVGGGTGGVGSGGSGSGRPGQTPSWNPPSGHQTVPTPPVHQVPTGPGPIQTMPYPAPHIPSTGIDHAPTVPTAPNPNLPNPNLPNGGQVGPLPGGGNLGGGGGGHLPGGMPPGGLGGLGGGGGAGRGGSTAGAGRAGGAGTTGAGARPGGTAGGSAPGAGQAGRAGAPGMGGMPHAGGAGGGAGARGGAGGGRAGGGLVGRSGGTVGGRRGPAAGGEFTQGGTGLRGRAERGADGRSGQGGFGGGHGAAGAGRKDRNRGNRPDYLIEDEDTWTSGSGPVNPGVIE